MVKAEEHKRKWLKQNKESATVNELRLPGLPRTITEVRSTDKGKSMLDMLYPTRKYTNYLHSSIHPAVP